MARHPLNGALAALVAVLLASTFLIVAAETAPAHGGSKTKTLTGKACTKTDPACARCFVAAKDKNKNKKKTTTTTLTTVCSACSTNGPIAAELFNGQCLCPAGSALVGSPYTADNAPAAKSTTTSAHGGGGKKNKGGGGGGSGGGPTPLGCAPCSVDAFNPSPNLAADAKCQPCPPGTSTNGATGATSCAPLPPSCGPPNAPCGPNAICNGLDQCVCVAGFYATSTTPVACAECGVNHYCPGGTADPSDRFACELGKDTNGVTTASSASQCVVSTCDPCGSSTAPTTYFTTGSTKSVYVATKLNPTTATTPPEASLVCTMPDTGDFVDPDSAINDIAATSTGQLLIAARPKSSNANGFILLLDPAAQTAGQPCVYRKLLDISPAVAGLGAGPKSDIFYGTGGSAFVYTYKLSETGGVPSLTALGSADVSTVVGGAIGASDVTAAPGKPNLLYFTAGDNGFTIGLDANGNPDATKAQQITSGSIGLGAPAAWCTSLGPFAGSSSTKNAYEFYSPVRRRSLLGGESFYNVGTTTMPVTGLSGAATVPSCSVDVNR